MFDDLDADALRRRSGLKWARAGPGVLPAWVADMDFPPPPAVREVLLRAIHDDDLGYPAWDELPGRNPLREAFAQRMLRRYGFRIDPGHVREFTDVNQALQVILHVATGRGDAVATHTPAYPPFLQSLSDMGRRLVPIPMTDAGGGWGFDAGRLADDVASHGCRALLLVNPHNPTGRVFRRDELAAIAEVALRHGLLVIADEIHSDLTYEPNQHVPFASLGAGTAGRTVTITSATKAFNIAGLRCAVAHVGDRRAREALDSQPPRLFGEVSALGVLATVAAWQAGDAWLAQVRAVLDRNRRLLARALPAGVGYRAPEAGYLAWLDCRSLGLGEDPAGFFLGRGGVMLSHGPDFGPGGGGFTRLNFATSGRVLEEILRRMREAVREHAGR